MAATTTYIVHYHYDASKDDELTLEVGDVIAVSDMSDPGWWVGHRVKDGAAGLFPSNFVEPHEESAAVEPVAAATLNAEPEEADTTAVESAPEVAKNEGPILARVEYDYEAKESGELSLEAGRVVTILDSSDPAWWKGDSNGKIGTFPSNHVKLIENKEEEAASGEKPAKFRLAAFGVKQGGLGSLFAGGVVPGLKKTGGLKKLSGDGPAIGTSSGASKRTSIDEPRSSGFSAAPPSKLTAPVAEEVVAPLINNPTPVRGAPPAPPLEEVAASPEPRVPSRAKKPKAKQIKALVVYEYAAQEDDEISLAKGSTVVVTDKMGDEGWWSGRNEQGEVGNFPSDFVQELKEEAVPSPSISSATPAPASAADLQDNPPKSPVHSRPTVHAPVALPAIPTEPLRSEPLRTRTNETAAPMATPPAIPRGSRPPSMIASPTPTSAQPHDVAARSLNDGPPLPGSPPPKRMSMASRSSSHDYPGSPRLASVPMFPEPTSPTTTSAAGIPGDLSRSSTLRRPQKPIPEAPLHEAEETHADDMTSSSEDTVEAPATPTSASSHSNRNSYILPTPVSRNRPLPPLARPPSIHQAAENRKSTVLPPTAHLPPVPGEPEESAPAGQGVHPTVIEEEKEEAHEPEEEHHLEHEHEPEEEKETATHQDHGAAHVTSPEDTDKEAEEHGHESTVAIEAVKHVEEHYQEESLESSADVTTDTANVIHEDTAVEEAEPEKPKLPEMESSGPALSHASRPRPAKGRKPPSAPVPNPEASFVSQLEADVKASPIVEEKKPEPVVAAAPAAEKAAPPPKPIKPIFQKFPTPFAGAQPSSVALRPTGRRAGSGNEAPQSPDSSSSPASSLSGSGSAPAPAGGAPPPAGGVKSLSSRFGQFQGVPASGGGSSAALELEIAKLRRWMTEELDRVKKELADERESREKLEQEVKELRAQLQG